MFNCLIFYKLQNAKSFENKNNLQKNHMVTTKYQTLRLDLVVTNMAWAHIIDGRIVFGGFTEVEMGAKVEVEVD